MFEKKNFCLRILCVSQKFGPRIFVKKNFMFWKRTFCLITGILCLEKEFLSQNFVCVCVLRIFVSEFLSQNFCLRIFVFLEIELFL